ncbi:MAG: glycerate 2-kinase, partial [Gammaproteobacteria bacterium]
TCTPTDLPAAGKRTVVIGAGKASGAMAKALEDSWEGELSGIVAVPAGYEQACDQIEIITASHPVPDERSVAAAQKIKQAVSGLNKDDLVIALISGGGSALMAEPIEGIDLALKQQVTKGLLMGGATIQEINTVRKQLSQIKGGQLAAAVGEARLETWLISDVPGDDPSFIASGPTVTDASTKQDAIKLLNKYLDEVPSEVLSALDRKDESKPNIKGTVRMIGSPMVSLLAAAEVAKQHGYTPIILGDALEGESQDAGLIMAGIAKCVALHGRPIKAPAVLLSGGETTVTHRGEGKGGPNQEFMLGMLGGLDSHPKIHALAIDTDGRDGSEPVAGAFIGPTTLEEAKQAGLSYASACEQHDSYTFFTALGNIIDTGPTFTNVNDFRAVLIEA